MVADSLRDDYIKSRHSGDEDEWPPNQPKTVVNVALIHYKGSRTEQELIEISKRHKEGTHAVDELAHHSRSRVTTDIAKIFAAGFNDSTETGATSAKPPNFILIEGAPGIGKTVLAKRIAYLWAIKELLTDTNILFLLYLRDPELQNVKTPAQLIQYLTTKCFDNEEVNNCVKQVMEVKVGIVMDGFDEYPIKLHKKSFIADLIKGKVFHNYIVVLTSRPTATIYLHDKVDRRVEILGFAQEERDQYISDSLDSPEQRRQLQDYLKCQPIINGLIYVPLHLAVLLYLFKRESKLPETLTEMNNSFTIHTIYRSMTKNDLTTPGVVTVVDNLKDLPKTVSNILNKLSKLALVGLQKNQLVFTYAEIKANCPEIENDIPGAFNGFGLLQVVQYLPNKGAGVTVSFNFLHFTMQEFLAAFHVSNSIPPKQQLRLMKETFWINTYNFMWMMYIGINGINSHAFLQFLYNAQAGVDVLKFTLSDSVTTNKLKCLHLFQCFMEAKSKEVPKEISAIFYNNEIDFHGVQLLPYHISAINLYISKYSTCLQSLNLRDCHIGDVGMSILEHFFTTNPDKASSIKHIDLFGNNSVLLWNVYCAIFGQQNLTKLNWSSLGGVNIEEIVNVMNNNMTVQSLNLSNNHFKDDDVERIAAILSNNETLQELDFSSNDISTKGAIALSESLQNNYTLQHLKLSWNGHVINTGHTIVSFSQESFKNADVHIVAKILCKNQTVTKLDLSQNKISGNGVESISECIKNNKSLKEIDVSRNKISNMDLWKITSSLQMNQILQKLNISYNNISGDGAVAIGECLKNNSTLQELNMSHNKLSNDGIINIGKALQINSTLRLLDISYNKISDNGVITFSDHLKRKSRLRELRISWNHHDIYLVLDFMVHSCAMCEMSLGDTGVILISALLFSNTNIQILDISHNNISDDGAIAISECLKNNNTLRELNISHNKVSNNGIVYIGKALQVNAILCSLDISYNKTSDNGVIIFSDNLKNRNKLQELRISWNDGIYLCIDFMARSYTMCKMSLGDTGAILISACLHNNANLQKLDVSYNKIFYDGAVAISECLESNNVLQELNISHNELSNNGIITICKALQVNTTLLIFDISHNKISDDGAVAIGKCLKNNNTLQVLNMSCNVLSNNGIISISKALQMNSVLQMLDISYNNISDDGAIAIGEALRSYYKDNSMVTTNGKVTNEDNIQNCTLQKLNMSYNNISSEGIVALSNCLKKNSTLQELTVSWGHKKLAIRLTNKFCDMSRKNFGNIGATLVSVLLSQNNRIQKLNISCNHISEMGAAAISEFLKTNRVLKELNISNNNIGHGIIKIAEAIQMNTTLKLLDISHNDIPRCREVVTALSDHLKHNNTLQVLGISWNDSDTTYVYTVGINNESYVDNIWPKSKWTNNTVQYVHECNYKELHYWPKFDKFLYNITHRLQKLQFDDIEAILLTALLHDSIDVTKLKIVRSKISYNAAVVISSFLEACTLQEFEISKCKISNEVIKQIMKAIQTNTTLQTLDISYIDLTDDGISECLKINNALKVLNISGNVVSERGAKIVAKFIQENTTLLSMYFCDNKISDSGAVVISESLKLNTILKEFSLSVNKITSYGISTTAEMIQVNTTLQKLDISHNSICDDGAVAVGECLKLNRTLEELNLSDNNITSKGIVKIAEVIKIAKLPILKLDISHNSITDNGAIAISKCLKSNNSTLTELDVSWNKITNNGAVGISEAIKSNKSLQKLDISHNNLSRDIAPVLNICFKHNSTLQELIISWRNANIMFVYTATTECYVDIIWPHPVCYNHTEYFVRKYSSYHSWPRSESKLATAGPELPTFGDIEAILLISLLHSNTKLKILNKAILNHSALCISDFLEQNKTLKELELSQNKISSEAFKKIMKAVEINSSLQTLDISSNNVSDDGAVAISKCLKSNCILVELRMSSNNVTVYGIKKIGEAIQRNKTLRLLDISHNNISRQVEVVTVLSDYLKHNNALQVLGISWNDSDTTYVYTVGINNESYVDNIWPKYKWTNNTVHYVHECNYEHLNTTTHGLELLRFGYTEAILLTAFLHGHTDVRKLQIARAEISNSAAVVISDFLKVSKTLQKLNLSWNIISSKAFKQIIQSIQTNTTLLTFNIACNNISDEIAVSVSDCLKHNKTLRVLDISKSDITKEVKIIANSIQKNTTCNNRMSDDGVVAISESLTINNTLQELSLSWNSTTTEGITKIAEAIAVNTGLHTLDVSSQHVNDPVYFTMTLLTAMEHNHTMMRIVLPTSVKKNEAEIKNKLEKLNEERIKADIETLVLEYYRHL